MNEDDIFKELFQKVDLNYSHENLEEAVLQKIKVQQAYKKQKNLYTVVGKIGFACFISLCFVFALIIGDVEPRKFGTMIYWMLGIPFILIVLMVQLEVLATRRTPKRAIL